MNSREKIANACRNRRLFSHEHYTSRRTTKNDGGSSTCMSARCATIFVSIVSRRRSSPRPSRRRRRAALGEPQKLGSDADADEHVHDVPDGPFVEVFTPHLRAVPKKSAARSVAGEGGGSVTPRGGWTRRRTSDGSIGGVSVCACPSRCGAIAIVEPFVRSGGQPRSAVTAACATRAPPREADSTRGPNKR